MITIKETYKRAHVVSNYKNKYSNPDKHIEKYKITTVYFLFIPVFIYREIASSTI